MYKENSNPMSKSKSKSRSKVLKPIEKLTKKRDNATLRYAFKEQKTTQVYLRPYGIKQHNAHSIKRLESNLWISQSHYIIINLVVLLSILVVSAFNPAPNPPLRDSCALLKASLSQ